MTVEGWLRTLGGVVVGVSLAALVSCGGQNQEPWLSDGEAQILGDELQRSPDTAQALADRLKHRVASYRDY